MDNKRYIICPNCKGKKYLYDHFAGITSLGLSYLLHGRDELCSTCDGKGYIEIPE